MDKLSQDVESVWRIELYVLAPSPKIRHLVEDITRLLCPDPEHSGDCPHPWEIHSTELSEGDEREEVRLRLRPLPKP